MNRRTFLGGSLTMALAGTGAHAAGIPIIDTHIHLFDPGRPQGVPWPPKDNKVLYKAALPDRYRKIAVPLGVVGAIEVEASPWLEDNQWVLDIAKHDDIIVGTVGDLEPGKPDFGKQLDRFHGNPLFRGIRYGNLWDRDIHNELPKPQFVADLKLLSRDGLALDTANPTKRLLADMVRVTQLVPDLRIILDHLPRLTEPADAELHELAKSPHVFVKISGVPQKIQGRIPEELAPYRPILDHLYGIFGEDKLIYGSDWPNSDNYAPYDLHLKLVREYFGEKGQAVSEKYFWKNSMKAYRWVKRDAAQQMLKA